jgi:hypothetical protein
MAHQRPRPTDRLDFADYFERSAERDRVGPVDASGRFGPTAEASPAARPKPFKLAGILRSPAIGDVSPVQAERITREVRLVYRLEIPRELGGMIDILV